MKNLERKRSDIRLNRTTVKLQYKNIKGFWRLSNCF